MDRKFIITALCYAILGMLLGIYMAASKNHGELVTHAHIMLAGFVVSFIYGLCHKLWLHNNTSMLAQVQFYLHQLGVLGMVVGLFLLYGQFVAPEKIEALLAPSTMLVLVAMVLMTVLVIRAPKQS